jgi:serine/threonine protein kinase
MEPISLSASFLHMDSFDASELYADELDASNRSDASSNEICSEHFPSDGGCLFRRPSIMAARLPSMSTTNATIGRGEDSPNELAAEVALGVKEQFRQMLPQNLRHEYSCRDCFAPFQNSEIVIGRKLGSGEFSHVFEIRCFKKDEAIEASLDDEQRTVRNYMKTREKYRDTRKASYAVKHLRQELITRYDKLEYAQAASDLAMEAEFLSSLRHPNIIKLRGISFQGPKGFQQGPKGFFLIIDRLDETLDKRLMKWERARKGILPNRKPILKKKDSNGDSLITEEQLDVCLRIAAALVYLHKKNIIFRDLKPANVGFDVRGDVKLFDFGLATIVSPEGDPYEDTYAMSGAGSPRYMAPEVLKEEPDHYNLKADVYTFSIVMWQVLSLKQPFSFVRSRDELAEHVVNQGGRPEIPESWPEAIKENMRAAFDADMGKRPSMSSFYETLRLQLLQGADTENSNKFDHRSIHRRRSTHSMSRIINGEEEIRTSHWFRAKWNKNLDRVRDKLQGRRFTD